MDDTLFGNPYTNFTLVNNFIFDAIMPTLSSDGWKVLSVAIRQAWGGAASGDGAAKQGFNISQCMTLTGIAGRSAVDRAIEECVLAGYLKQASEGGYVLNLDYRHADDLSVAKPATKPAGKSKPKPVAVEAVDLPPEKETVFHALLNFGESMGLKPDENSVRQAVMLNEERATFEWISLGRGMTNLGKEARFAAVLKRLLAQVPPVPASMLADEDFSDVEVTPEGGEASAEEAVTDSEPAADVLWSNTLTALRPKMRSSLFKWFKPTKAVELVDNVLVVTAPNQRTKDWLETGKLSEVIKDTFVEVAGEDCTLKFVVEE